MELQKLVVLKMAYSIIQRQQASYLRACGFPSKEIAQEALEDKVYEDILAKADKSFKGLLQVAKTDIQALHLADPDGLTARRKRAAEILKQSKTPPQEKQEKTLEQKQAKSDKQSTWKDRKRKIVDRAEEWLAKRPANGELFSKRQRKPADNMNMEDILNLLDAVVTSVVPTA